MRNARRARICGAVALVAALCVATAPARAAAPPPASLAVAATVHVDHITGDGAVVFSRSGAKAYIAGGVNALDAITDTVDVVSATSGAVLKTITVGGTPASPVVSPNGAYLYVYCGYDNVVSVIQPETATLLATIPVGTASQRSRPAAGPPLLAFTPDSRFAYLSDLNTDQVVVIETATSRVVARVPVGPSPGQVLMAPDGKHAYVANRQGNSVSVIDTATRTVGSTIALPEQVGVIGLARGGAELWTTPTSDSSGLRRVDLATGAVTGAPIPVGAGAHDLVLTPSAATAFVTAGDGTVTAIDTRTGAVRTARIPPFLGPAGGLGAALSGRRLFVNTIGGQGLGFKVASPGVTVAVDTTTMTVTDLVSTPAFARTLTVAPDGRTWVHQASSDVKVIGPLRTAAPVVTLQPVPTQVQAGDPVTFHAAALGTPTPSIQWQRSADERTWTDLAGATDSSYTIAPAFTGDGAAYRAVFSNSAGTAISNVARLYVSLSTSTVTVTAPTDPTPFATPLTVGARVAPLVASRFTPTGTVEFRGDGGAVYARVPLAADGTATFTTSGLSVGTNYIRADYSGDQHFASSTGSAQPEVSADIVINDQTVAGNLYVPPGKSLWLVNSRVTGRIDVQGSSTLEVDGSTVGELVALGSQGLRVCGSTVDTLTVGFATGFVLAGKATDGCAPNHFSTPTFGYDQHGVQAVGNDVTGTVTNLGNSGAGPFPLDTVATVDAGVDGRPCPVQCQGSHS